jgi:hypothetical protein
MALLDDVESEASPEFAGPCEMPTANRELPIPDEPELPRITAGR